MGKIFRRGMAPTWCLSLTTRIVAKPFSEVNSSSRGNLSCELTFVYTSCFASGDAALSYRPNPLFTLFTISAAMANRDFSPHQQKVIKRYYDNRDAIDDQRLAELVTNLYLSSGKKQEKMWETAEGIMTRMELPPTRIANVMKTRDPAVLAKVVEELNNGKLKKGTAKKATEKKA